MNNQELTEGAQTHFQGVYLHYIEAVREKLVSRYNNYYTISNGGDYKDK